MLSLIGFSIIFLVMILILTKLMHAMSALIVIPILGGLLAGFGLETFDFAISGIRAISPFIIMFVFAILFFGIMKEVGLFDPIIQMVIQKVGLNPVYVVVGTAILSMLVHLDGSGATTFLIAVPAMLPIYEKLKIDKRVLACVVGIAAGTMNILPWGGPTIRAAGALGLEVTDVYRPIMIPQLVGLLCVIGIAIWLGIKEKGKIEVSKKGIKMEIPKTKNIKNKLTYFVNLILTLVVIGVLISGKIPPAICFMLGVVIALLVNFPNTKNQLQEITEHAKPAMMMALVLSAAGIFTGILKESGMLQDMASSLVDVVPTGISGKVPLILALFSMPMSLLFDPNSYYFGVLPVLSEMGTFQGIEPVTYAHASLMGQMTTGFPLSPLTAATFLLIGLTGIDLADHQRFSFKYAFLVTLVMTTTSILLGVIPL